MKDLESIKSDSVEIDQEYQVSVGQWFWVKDTEFVKGKELNTEWLGCVVRMGSNYIKIQKPSHDECYSSTRIHFDNIQTDLRFEPDPISVIKNTTQYCKERLDYLMSEVRRLSSKLGIDSSIKIEKQDNSKSLAVLSNTSDVKNYEKALTKAKEKELPDLFKLIKEENKNLTKWMKAESIPLIAQSEELKTTLDSIDSRIFNISLYAGLTENVQQCYSGEPADMLDKLHVMQRRLYMDEECLLDYQKGGIDIQSIQKFDDWISKPKNRDRILPFPKCIVSMQVRRNTKYRSSDGSISKLFVNIQLEQADTSTFLYIRNGENVYRISCDLDFDEMLFPDKSLFNSGEPMMVMMVRYSSTRIKKMITVREYEVLLKEYEERLQKRDQWYQDTPEEVISRNPCINQHTFSPSNWEPFNSSNLYYDDCVKNIEDQIKKYNRIATIIQGLFDRSTVLQPHPPVKIWTASGFEQAVTLVYDSSNILNYGDAPDFELYRAKCNESLCKGSVTVGQRKFWKKQEAEKENRRLDNDWRSTHEYRHKEFEPYGNQGPGKVDIVQNWKPRVRKATYFWNRERLFNKSWNNDVIKTSIVVPASQLLNISAYTPGDFKQFFQDPRTRSDYIKWADMLLTAENYYLEKE